MKIYLTVRERAMEAANEAGRNAYPYGVMPAIYKGDGAEHLAEAWRGGYNQRKREAILYHEVGYYR